MQLCHCRWFRIDSNGPTSLEDFTVSFGVLALENVQSEDSGTYRCTASNSVGQSQYDIRLEVVEPLRAEISGGDVVVNQGKSTTLRCWFSSWTQATVKWYKDGVAISHRDKYQPIGKDSLRINSMQRTDQGIYQCFVSTERASAQAFVHLILGGTRSIDLIAASVPSIHSHSKTVRRPLSPLLSLPPSSHVVQISSTDRLAHYPIDYLSCAYQPLGSRWSWPIKAHEFPSLISMAVPLIAAVKSKRLPPI